MSDQSNAAETTSRSVAILGADALLVALPCTPTQLANACFAGGYAEVFPATWGDELIASGCLEQLESRTGPAIFCSCPLVAEQLRGAAELKRFIVPLISPPVAVARYLRALYADDDLRITYIGDCPGADDESIDERLSPHELLANLAKRGILPATQRPDLGTHAAHDRRRFYSIPGGVPSPQWLSAQWPRRTLVDVHAGDALANLASQTNTRGNTLIDFAPHLGCACAGAVGGADTQDARKAVIALEPPRSQTEVVSAAVRVEVSLAPAGEHQPADVTWGDFLAALPAALAMPADGHAATPAQSRRNSGSRRARERKAALPRAYLATRQGARRERTGPRPARAAESVSPSVMVARAAAATARATQAEEREVSAAPRDEVSSARPSPWIGRRSAYEGMTGPRGSTHRARLAPADRWLLAGLMIAGSVLVAVLTSAFTVRGMQHTDAPPVFVQKDSVVTPTVATAVVPPAIDTTIAMHTAIGAPDSASLVLSTHAPDSAPEHEDGGTVAPPAAATHLSPMPEHRAPVREVHREPVRVEHRPAPPVQRTHAAPASVATTTALSTRESSAQPTPAATSVLSSSSASPVAAPTSTTVTPTVASPTPPSSAPAPAAAAAPAANTPASNQQVLDELRAIHAEIDARKKHVDSLARALDSLKHS